LKIELTCIRTRKQDQIHEIFKWTPTRFYLDDSRALAMKVRFAAARMSLHNKTQMKLIDINYFTDTIVYYYDITKDLPGSNNIETLTIPYSPTLGRKTCRNCSNYKIWKTKKVCLLRKKPVDKLVGCFSWSEAETELRKGRPECI